MLLRFPLLLLLGPGDYGATSKSKAGDIRHLEVGGDACNFNKCATHAGHAV
jgi:hypothetical protein